MIIGNRIILREKKLADARDDYTWESDPELAQLDAAPVVTMPFAGYKADYAEELRRCFIISHRFAIETLDGKHIGNCSYYNISGTRGEAELGIMIGHRDYWNKGYGAEVVTILVNHIFDETKLERIHLKTLESNSRAQKCFQKCGFRPCGYMTSNGFDFVLMEIYRKQWLKRSTGTKVRPPDSRAITEL